MTDPKAIPGGRDPVRPPSIDVVQGLEEALVGKVFIDPAALSGVLEVLEAGDLSPPRRAVFDVLREQHEAGFPCSLAAVLDDLDRAGTLELAGGPAAVHELSCGEATAVDVLDVARRVHRLALEGRARLLALRIASGDREPETRTQLRSLEEQLEAVSVGALDLAVVGFSGARLEDLRKRPERVSPFPKLLPPEPALAVLNAKPKTGKSTFAGFLAQAWACGVSPWEGAPELPGSRALVLSAEQPVERVDATLRRLDTMSENITREKWSQRVTLIARDPELPKAAARMLTLDGTGRALLRQGLLRARREGDHFGLVVLDSLSRLTPEGFDENDNSHMTAWLAPLQELAEELGTYIVTIHHVGHADRNEARTAGRGASAIAAVAQAVWLLENSTDDPRQRKLHIQGNAVPETRLLFSVAGEKNEPGAILYWRPADPLEVYSLDELVAEGEEISTTGLAWRLQGEERAKGKSPKGQYQRKAAQLRESWLRTGAIETFKGGHGAKMIRRPRVETTGEDSAEVPF